MSSRSIVASLLSMLVVTGCSSKQNDDADLLGQAQIALTSVPSDVRCLRVNAAGARSVVRDIDLVPSTPATSAIRSLPTGAVTFTAAAFPSACASTAADAVGTWLSDAPVTATLSAGTLVPVKLTMRKNGGASLEVDFADDDASVADAAATDAAAPTCSAVGAACASGADCCSANCDPTSKKCAAPLDACKLSGAACTTATECCSSKCSGGVCANAMCSSDGKACASGSDCCSGTCTGGTCAALNATCRTSGNTCAADGDCCSGACRSGLCTEQTFTCRQTGDSCSADGECCGGICSKATGATIGTCRVPTISGAPTCNVVGERCSGSTCGSTCCSKTCAPAGGGYSACVAATGCRPAGEACRNDTDCCGSTAGAKCSKENAGDLVGRCTTAPGCAPAGTVCRQASSSCSFATNCCVGNVLANALACQQDAVGVPRCTTTLVDCTTAGSRAGASCSSGADCCGLPCVPSSGGQYVCASACINAGGTCTADADCCAGSRCNRGVGAGTGTCLAK